MEPPEVFWKASGTLLPLVEWLATKQACEERGNARSSKPIATTSPIFMRRASIIPKFRQTRETDDHP
jgi:hypothetical protein